MSILEWLEFNTFVWLQVGLEIALKKNVCHKDRITLLYSWGWLAINNQSLITKPDLTFRFQDICKFMKGELKEEVAYVILRGIVGLGMHRIERRDEIYCQLYRQTNSNPHNDYLLRLWLLWCLCAVCISPSRTLNKVGIFKVSSKSDIYVIALFYNVIVLYNTFKTNLLYCNCHSSFIEWYELTWILLDGQ